MKRYSLRVLFVLVTMCLGICALAGCSGNALQTTASSNEKQEATSEQSAASSDNEGAAQAASASGDSMVGGDNSSASESSDASLSNDAQESQTDAGGNESSKSEESSEPDTPVSSTISVSVTIDATEGGGSQSSYVVTLDEGASVYDALVKTGASISGSQSYVRGINGLREFSMGAQSGWKYKVNGEYPSADCESYTLQNGDSVVWVFVLEV